MGEREAKEHFFLSSSFCGGSTVNGILGLGAGWDIGAAERNINFELIRRFRPGTRCAFFS